MKFVPYCMHANMHHRNFFPPTPSDLPSATSASTASATEPDSELGEVPTEPPAPLDTQASSLIAAAAESTNNESPNAKKLKVTNPDPDVGDDWETIEKPEDFLADEDPKPAVDAGSTAEEAKEVAGGKAEGKGEAGEGSLSKNALLKDW